MPLRASSPANLLEPVTIEIIHATVAQRRPVSVGEVLTVPRAEADALIVCGRAKLAARAAPPARETAAIEPRTEVAAAAAPLPRKRAPRQAPPPA